MDNRNRSDRHVDTSMKIGFRIRDNPPLSRAAGSPTGLRAGEAGATLRRSPAAAMTVAISPVVGCVGGSACEPWTRASPTPTGMNPTYASGPSSRSWPAGRLASNPSPQYDVLCIRPDGVPFDTRNGPGICCHSFTGRDSSVGHDAWVHGSVDRCESRRLARGTCSAIAPVCRETVPGTLHLDGTVIP